MRRTVVSKSMRRSMRVVAAAVTFATVAMSGLLVGPTPQQAAAALVATGVNDSLTMKHDRTSVVPAPGVLGNDLNLLGGSTAILVSGVSHGTLSLRSDGGYTHTPSAGYVGADSFRYHPSGVLYTTATVTITITNATPVARPDVAPDRTGGSRSGVLIDAPALDLGLGTLGVLAGVEIWAVPAAVIGGPGLLVLLWMALQAGGAMAWLPAALRLRNDDVSRARRRH